MYEFIKTSATLRLENFKVVKMDVFKFIQSCTDKFDFIFAGPPYALTSIDDLPKHIFEQQLLKKVDGLCWSIHPGTITKHFLSINLNGTMVLLFSLLLLRTGINTT